LSGTAPSLTYTPDSNYFGADSFTFKVNDGTADSNVATVTVDISPVNDLPVAYAQSVTLDEDTSTGIILTGNDPDGDPLIFSVVTQPVNGTLSGTAPNLTYTPYANYYGLDSFTFLVNDGVANSNIATVSITIRQEVDPNDLIFKNSFESCDLLGWSGRVIDGGDLSASSAAALIGSCGMQALIDDNTGIYVADYTPLAEPHYRARFYFDPNSISMVNGNSHNIFYGITGSSTTLFRIGFRYTTATGYQLDIAMINDAGVWTSSTYTNLSDATHFIEIEWLAASGVGANDGLMKLWIDGSQALSLSGMDTDARRVDAIRLGAVQGIDTGTRGTTFFDEFESRRSSYIGP
jgi:hypothetical protein